MDGKPAKSSKTKWAELVVELAARVYGCHSHNGRVYVSAEYALRVAATLVGAAQSPGVLDLIEHAKNDPASALDSLRRSQATVADAIDADRRQQMSDWADALKSGEGH